MNRDFHYVDAIVDGIRWDAKYATWDNFTGRPVDGYLSNRVVGTTTMCAALDEARDHAASGGFGLLLWDCYRPQRAVDAFVRSMVDLTRRRPKEIETLSQYREN